jgi:tetratricopeptide (TPR) repeat protein
MAEECTAAAEGDDSSSDATSALSPADPDTARLADEAPADPPTQASACLDDLPTRPCEPSLPDLPTQGEDPAENRNGRSHAPSVPDGTLPVEEKDEYATAYDEALAGPPAANSDQQADTYATRAENLDHADSGPLTDNLADSEGPATSRMASTTKPATPATAAPPDVPGYEILGVLGRGGMGVVYKARQVGLKRIVALKMILGGGHAGTQERARFRAEAEAVARLQHPNIVQVYEVGEHHDLPFFSLEYCPGGSLASELRGNPKTAQDAARLVETLARGMHAAHQVQIVHRDLKPANILLGADGTPKITDFGLAKDLGIEDGQTQTGAVMGTPSYMAPEQAAGALKEIGPWTDTYALGALLYELLTGRPPFKGPSVWDTVDQVRQREPVPPNQLQPGVPRDLETICLKCLSKAPAQRYPSALALAEDLRRFLNGEPVLARPVPGWQRLLKWARRRPAQAALAGSVFLALLACIAGAVFYGLYQNQVAESLQKQVERGQTVQVLWAQGQEAESHGRLDDAAEKLDRALATLDADPDSADPALRDRVAKQRQRVRKLLDEQAARRQLQAKVKQFLEARDDILFHELAPTARDRSASQAEIRRLAPAALTLWNIHGDGPPDSASQALAAYRGKLDSRKQAAQVAAGCAEVLLAWAESEADLPPTDSAARRQSGLKKAVYLLDAADAIGRAHGLPTSEALHLRKARYLEQLGDKEAARAEKERAAQSPPTTARDFFLAGLEGWLQGKLDKAAKGCDEALRLEPGNFWAQYLQALCHFRARHWAEAKLGFTACLGRRGDLFWPRLLRAFAYGELGQAKDAASEFAHCLEQAGSDPFQRYVVLTNRGAFWVHQKELDKALADLGEAAKLQPKAYEAEANLGELYRQRKEFDQAQAALTRALRLRPGDPNLYYSRARIQLERKDWPAARQDFEQALVHEPKASTSVLAASAHVELAQLYQRDGDYARALAACEAALQARPNYSPAYREQARTLLAQGNVAEAGKALDRYLAATPKAGAEIYAVRGRIYDELSQFSKAVDSYSRSLALRPDAEVRSRRGWAYLRLRAVPAAVEDFKEALRLEPDSPLALCGQAHALLTEGHLERAVADAEGAVKDGKADEYLLLKTACLYSRAVGVLLAGRKVDARSLLKVQEYQRRGLALLRAALAKVPADKRAAFWRQSVEPEPTLGAIRASEGMMRLEQRYGQ